MEGDFIKINEWLLPLSWLYGLAVRLRNFCYDVGLLKSRAFRVPVISVGNITVGGTGKTPHVEYLVSLLKNRVPVAVLSRGYKRKTRGFLVAAADCTARDVGDEPCQMKHKFPDVTVAVDGRRTRGIDTLTANDADLGAVLLDDAFQHRAVKPGINILLVDYHRLIIYDRLLPAGRLREPLKGKDRADIVIVTKCPSDLKPMEYRIISKAMNLYPYQQLFFTTLAYDNLQPLFPAEAAGLESRDTAGSPSPDTAAHGVPLSAIRSHAVLLLTGIASPRQMTEDLKPLAASIEPLAFPDHHAFSRKDVERINAAFAALPEPRCVITTEKDAVRLSALNGLSEDVRQHIYSLPVRVRFMLDEEEKFNENIIGYVRKNSRNSILAKRKDENISQDRHYSGDGTRTISFRNN